MNLQETIIQLNELKLRGMSSSFEAMTSLPVQNRPSLEVAISKMVDAEVQDRRDRETTTVPEMPEMVILPSLSVQYRPVEDNVPPSASTYEPSA